MKVYLVGGAVRDAIMGLTPGDRDYCVTGATPEEMIARGFVRVGREFPVFLHPKTHEEYALARTERKRGHGYGGFVCSFSPDVTLEEDLIRRDLTVNAMARDADGRLIDPCGGRRDIESRTLRHASPAFAEDPLRVLRLARFYAAFAPLGFTVAAETADLCREIAASGELGYLTAERVWQETRKALAAPAPEKFFELLAGTGALGILFPELDALRSVPLDPAYHPEGDCFAHTMLALRAVSRLTPNPLARFAMVTHDLGKAEESRFPDRPDKRHRVCGPAIAEALCARLKAPKNFAALAKNVCRHHGYRLLTRADPAAVNRIFLDFGAYRDCSGVAVLGQCLRADFRGRKGYESAPFYADYFLNFMLAKAAAVKNAAVLGDGFAGPAVTAELNRRREEAVRAAQRELERLYPGREC